VLFIDCSSFDLRRAQRSVSLIERNPSLGVSPLPGGSCLERAKRHGTWADVHTTPVVHRTTGFASESATIRAIDADDNAQRGSIYRKEGTCSAMY